MMPSETNIRWHLADQLRSIRNLMIPPNSYECRYEERTSTYTLRSWHEGKEVNQHGKLNQRPEWLTIIIDVARLSGHYHKPPEPPPNAIMWFITDADNRLIEFINFAREPE